jgi:hypothetical protein
MDADLQGLLKKCVLSSSLESLFAWWYTHFGMLRSDFLSVERHVHRAICTSVKPGFPYVKVTTKRKPFLLRHCLALSDLG